jgi:hypothetical protein
MATADTGAQAHAAPRRLRVLLRSGVESRLGLVVGPIYAKATDKRILKLLDKPPPEGFAR